MSSQNNTKENEKVIYKRRDRKEEKQNGKTKREKKRLEGKSKNNFYTLFDLAMLGIVSQSIVPLRVASFLGIIFGFFSFLVSFIFLIKKLFFWDSFQLGIAPLLIGIFFVGGLILIGIGILGEYIASVHTYLRNRPIVVEKERINFD